MTHVIRQCLDRLSTMPIDAALEVYPSATKISAFARALIDAPEYIKEGDLLALKQLLVSPDVPEDIKTRIFTIGIRAGLHSEEDINRIVDVCASACQKEKAFLLIALSMLQRKSRTETALLTLRKIYANSSSDTASLERILNSFKKLRPLDSVFELALGFIGESDTPGEVIQIIEATANLHKLIIPKTFKLTDNYGKTHYDDECKKKLSVIFKNNLQIRFAPDVASRLMLLTSIEQFCTSCGNSFDAKINILNNLPPLSFAGFTSTIPPSEIARLDTRIRARILLRVAAMNLARDVTEGDPSMACCLYLDNILKILKGISDPKKIEEILDALAFMPGFRHLDLNPLYTFVQHLDIDLRAEFLREFTSLEELIPTRGEELLYLTKRFLPYLNEDIETGVGEYKKELFKEFIRLARLGKENIILNLVKDKAQRDIFQKTVERYSCRGCNIFMDMMLKSEEQRASLIEKCNVFDDCLLNEDQFLELLSLIDRTSEENLEESLRFLRSLKKTIPNFDVLSKALGVLLDIPVKEREELLEWVDSITRSSTPGSMYDGTKLDFIRSLIRVPREQRKEVIDIASPFMEGLSVGNAFRALDNIAKCKTEDRKSLLDLAPKILELSSRTGTTDSASRGSLIEHITKFPADLRSEILDCMKDNISPTLDPASLRYILEALEKVPQDHIFDILRLMIDLVNNLPRIAQPTAGNQLLNRICELPATEAIEILIMMGSIAPTCAMSDFLSLHIVDLLAMAPPSIRGQITSALCSIVAPEDNPERTFKSLWDFVSPNVPGMKDSIVSFLSTFLQDRAKPALQNKYANMIVNYQTAMGLHDEHPLFQLAISVLNITDPEAMLNPKNPYKVHDQLQKYESEAVVLDKRALSFTPLLQEAQKIRSATTFAALPSEIGPSTFRDLMGAFDQRIFFGVDSISEEQAALRSTVLAFISSSYSISYDLLRSDHVHDPFLSNLLSVSGAPEEKVPADSAILYAILKHIMNLSNEVQEGKVLSPREEAFIGMLCIVKNCPGGKKDGLYKYYQLIQGDKVNLESWAQRAVREHVYEAVYGLLSSFINDDTPVMRDLTHATSPVIQQLSHQAIFLKNLIGKKIGLVCDLFFDRHTFVLYDDLLETTPQQAIDKLLEHFCLASVAAEVQKAINKAFSEVNSSDRSKAENANALYHKLLDCLGGDTSYFSVDEETDSTKINIIGALRLLAVLGYCKAIDTSTLLLELKDSCKNLSHITTLVEALGLIDPEVKNELFRRMYFYHVKTGKKSIDHEEYGKMAFMGEDPRITASSADREEVVRQVLIEHVLAKLSSSLSSDQFTTLLAQLERLDKDIANRLFGKMYQALRDSGHLGGYDYFGGGEAAFRKEGELIEDKRRAIELLTSELRR